MYEKFEIPRKLLHVFAGSILVLIYSISESLSGKEFGTYLLAFFVVVLTFELLRTRIEPAQKLFVKVFSSFLRGKEEVKPSAFPWFLLGLGLSFYFLDSKAAFIGMIFLVYCDPIASVVGRQLDSTRLIGNKTFEGTLGFWFSAFLIVFAFTSQVPNSMSSFDTLVFCLICSAGATISEILPLPVDDNFSVPFFGSISVQIGLFLYPVL